MKFSMKKNESGFSLVELMVVVGIIGILASLALPKLQVFMAKSKQAEAKTILPTVYALEQAYYADNNTYTTSVTNIGLNVTPKYGTAPTITAADTTTFNAQFVLTGSLLCTKGTDETWSIDQTKTLKQGGSTLFNAPVCP